MNYGDHNFIEITQQTKLPWVALVVSSASSQSSSSCRASRAVLFDKVDTAKMHGLDTSNVSSRVKSRRRAKWNLGLSPIVVPYHLMLNICFLLVINFISPQAVDKHTHV